MGKILKIAELGNPILRIKSTEIAAINEEILELIANMKFTVEKVSGVGLAAPQVFESQRAFIIASKPNIRYPNAPIVQPEAIINPVITSMSGDIVKDWEGCLSIPGIRGLVPRAISIEAEYTNTLGERLTRKFDDFIARIFQHEFDHLEGIVFPDRLESTHDLVTEKEYLKIISNK